MIPTPTIQPQIAEAPAWIPVAGLILVIIGWPVVYRLNKRQERLRLANEGAATRKKALVDFLIRWRAGIADGTYPAISYTSGTMTDTLARYKAGLPEFRVLVNAMRKDLPLKQQFELVRLAKAIIDLDEHTWHSDQKPQMDTILETLGALLTFLA